MVSDGFYRTFSFSTCKYADRSSTSTTGVKTAASERHVLMFRLRLLVLMWLGRLAWKVARALWRRRQAGIA
jgi:hypothetical protein